MLIWDWSFVIEILPELLKGLVVTIQATFLGFTLAMIFGLVMALGRRSENVIISGLTAALVEFIRLTPLLVQLFFVAFVMPRYLRQFGVGREWLQPFAMGVFVIGLHYGTYTSEVYRAGIDAIGRGQWEAAKALNFSARDTWVRVILPQAIPPMLPAFGNYLNGMFKETAQLSAITVVELLQSAQVIGKQSFRFLEPITMVGLLYFLVSYPTSLIVRRLEARFGNTN
jgi:polar amino acid transport system permease protein